MKHFPLMTNVRVIKKCNQNFSMIYKLKNILTKEKKEVLVHALIFSVLRYACVVWSSNLNKKQVSEIDKISRRCARFVMGKLKFDSISNDICSELKWLTTEFRIMYEITLLAYKLTFSAPNAVLHNYLDFSYVEAMSTRNEQYRTPAIQTNSIWGKKPFNYKAVQLWLQLPQGIFTTSSGETSLAIFRKNLMDHVLKMQLDSYNRGRIEAEHTYINETINYVSQLYKHIPEPK